MRTVIGVVLVAASLAACSSDSTSSGTTDTAVPTTEAADANTTAAPTTAAEPTTTVAPTTTAAPVVLTLRNDGIGPFSYGAVPDEVIAGLTAQFGAPISDVTDSYPNDNGAGFFHNADFSFAYKFPTSRTVCWSNGFCAAFGGTDPAAYTFTGWRYEADPASTLSTDLGLTIGSRHSDHPEIVQVPYPCYNDEPGSGYDGLTWIGETQPLLIIALRSEGIPFTMDAGATSSTPGALPPSDQMVVKRLAAGQYRVSIISQCG